MTYDLQFMKFEDYMKLFYTDPEFRAWLFGRHQNEQFAKSDDPMLSTTTGIWQILYGRAAFSMLHREVTAIAALPSVPWARDGVRVITADPTAKVTGIAENAALPDTDKPDYATYSTDTKWEISMWEVTEKAKFHARANEGLDPAAELRREYQDIHIAGLDELLLADASAAAAGASGDRAAADMLNIESLDRLISSDSEEDAFGGSHDHWFDPYGTTVDRDSGTTYDCIVLHNSGTDRAISTALLDQLIRDCEDAGAKKEYSFLLTTRETRDKIAALQQAQLRYIPTQRVQLSVNGIQTAKGQAMGFEVASYKDYPILVDKNVPEDTIGRVYLVDTRFMRKKLAFPTMYLESRGKADWFTLDRLKDMAAYMTVLEIECPNFAPHGKLRDLL
jgi:hypothetical protein